MRAGRTVHAQGRRAYRCRRPHRADRDLPCLHDAVLWSGGMNIWSALSQAFSGWMMILRGEAGWREQFSLTWPGLVTGLAIFLFCAFLAIAAASTYQGMPDLLGVLDAL